MNELQLEDGRTISFVQNDSDPLAYIDVLLETPKLKRELSELRVLVDELREFKNNILSLSQIGEGTVGLTVLLSTNDHKWLVTHRHNNRRDRLSDYCDTPEEAIRQALRK